MGTESTAITETSDVAAETTENDPSDGEDFVVDLSDDNGGLAGVYNDIIMGDTLCDYIFLTGYDLRRDRWQAGRLASIKVVFSESYETPEYTESDFERLYFEIEKDVNETNQDEETGYEETIYNR